MPPFLYPDYHAPLTGSIGDLILRRGEIAARQTAAGGAIAAQAAENIGTAISTAATTIGRDRLDAPRRQLETLQVNAATEAARDDQLFRQALAMAPNGDLRPAVAFLKSQGGAGMAALQKLEGLVTAQQGQHDNDAAAIGFQIHSRGNSPDAVRDVLLDAVRNGKLGQDDAESFYQQALGDPTKIPQLSQAMISRTAEGRKMLTELHTVKPGETGINGLGQTVISVPPDELQGAYTINGQRFDRFGRPIGGQVPKQTEPPKPGTVEDWVARSRRLAVAKNGGQSLTDEQLQGVDAAALGEFKETNADPEIRAATLAQKNLAQMLAQMQLNQQPTPEQAADVARDVVAHRLAPEQLASMFGGFGASGQAFKRMVYSEAKKVDPNFNWEEAAAEYGLVKSPSFQNTVRYMDSTIESMPRLLENARKLGNTGSQSINALINVGKKEFNSVDLKRFKTDVIFVGDEIAKILQGGGTGSATSDAKLKQAQDVFSTSDDAPAIAGALEEVQALLGNRRRTLTRGTYMEGTTAGKPATPAAAQNPFRKP